MKITYNIDKNDLLAFNEYHFFSRQKDIKIPKFVIILLILFFIVTILQKSLKLGYISLDFYDFLLILSIINLIFVGFFLKKFSLYFTKKALDKGNFNINLGNMTFEILEKQIYVKLEGGESKIDINKIIKFCENEKYFFIYTSSSSAYVIPKFKIQGDIQELFEFMKNKIDDNKKTTS